MHDPNHAALQRSLTDVHLALAVGLLSSVLAAISLWAGFAIASQATADCAAFPAPGLEFATGVAYLVSVPLVVAVMWTLTLLAFRFHPTAGLASAMLLSIAVVLLVASTHAFGLAPINVGECPSGEPPWWPGWLPQ
jgi:hypothetical protein